MFCCPGILEEPLGASRESNNTRNQLQHCCCCAYVPAKVYTAVLAVLVLVSNHQQLCQMDP